MNYFYSHLIEIDSVILALSELEISAEEKKKLEKLAHDQVREVIMDAILNELSEKDKRIFLANVRYENNEKIWKHLNEKVERIEEKIMMAAEDLKHDLHKDIEGIKRKSLLR